MSYASKTKTCLTILVGIALLGSLSADIAFANRRRRVRRRIRRRHRVVFRIVVGTPVRLRRAVLISGKPAGVVDFSVKPKTTQVFVDGTLRGTVNDFDGHPQYLVLRPGKHRLTLKPPDGEKVSEVLAIRAGVKLKIKLKLE